MKMAEAERRKLIDLRVVDLKLELEKRNIDRSGVKAVLLEKLQKALKDEGHDPETYMFSVAVAASPTAVEKKSTPTRSKGRAKSDGSESAGEDSEQEVIKDNSTGSCKTDENEDKTNKTENVEDEVKKKQPEVDENNEGTGKAGEKAKTDVEENGREEENEKEQGDTAVNDHEDSINLTIGEDEVKLLADEENTLPENEKEKDKNVKDESQPQGATDDKKGNEDGVVKSSTKSPAVTSSNDASGNRESGGDQQSTLSSTEDREEKQDGMSGSASGEKKSSDGDGGVGDGDKILAKKEEQGGGLEPPQPNDASSATTSSEMKQLSGAEDTTSSNSSRNLWVSGLSSTTRATDLKQVFSKFGKVVGAKVVTNARTPGARCYGYVTMASAEDASNSLKHLNLTELHGRMISVEKAKGESSGPPVRKSTGTGNGESSGSRSNRSTSGRSDHHFDRERTTRGRSRSRSRSRRERDNERERDRDRIRERDRGDRGRDRDRDRLSGRGHHQVSSPSGRKRDDQDTRTAMSKKREEKLVPPGTEGMDQDMEDSINGVNKSTEEPEPAAPGTEEQGETQPPLSSEKPSADNSADKSDERSTRDHDKRERHSRDSSRHRSERRSSKDRSPRSGRHRRATSKGSRSSGHHREILSFQQIKEERERQRLREKERELREEERRRREERDRQREIDRKQRDEAHRLERERDKLKREREKIERERAELLQLEKERQKLERERLDREREELKRQQLRLEEERRGTKRPLLPNPIDTDRYDLEPRKRPVPVDHRRYESSSSSSLNRSSSKPDISDIIRTSSTSRRGHHSGSRYEEDRIEKRYDHHSGSGFRGRGGPEGGEDIRERSGVVKERRSHERYNSSKDSGSVTLNRDGDNWHGSSGGSSGIKPFGSMSVNHSREVWACNAPLKQDSPQSWVRPAGHPPSERWISTGGGGGPVRNMGSRGAPPGIGSNPYPKAGPMSGAGPLGMSSGPMYGGDRFDAYKQPLGPLGRKF